MCAAHGSHVEFRRFGRTQSFIGWIEIRWFQVFVCHRFATPIIEFETTRFENPAHQFGRTFQPNETTWNQFAIAEIQSWIFNRIELNLEAGTKTSIDFFQIDELEAYFDKLNLICFIGLLQLGMGTMFSSIADLSGLLAENDHKNLYVSKVIHKAFIEVDEEGSTAGGSSGKLLTDKNLLCLYQYPCDCTIRFYWNEIFIDFFFEFQVRK